MFLGLIPAPPEGHRIKDLEAALEIAILMKAIPPPSKFMGPRQQDIIDELT